MFTVLMLNPISGAVIRTVHPNSIAELNAYLTFVAETGLYAVWIYGSNCVFKNRNAA